MFVTVKFCCELFYVCKLCVCESIRSCYLGNLRVDVGDFVHINNADVPDTIESAYLAKILDMFDNGKSFQPLRARCMNITVVFQSLMNDSYN